MMLDARPQRLRQNTTRFLPHTYDTSLVGTRIKVYWATDQTWYVGTVRAFDRVSGWHTVAYDDGDQQTEPLNDPQFHWMRHENANATAVVDPSHKPPPQQVAKGAEQVDSEVMEVEEAQEKEVEPEVVEVVAFSESEGEDEGDNQHVMVEEVTAEVLTAEEEGEDPFGRPLGEPAAAVESEIYQVERVLAERDGRFLVRWVGCHPVECTWEPPESFLDPTPIAVFRRAREAWDARTLARGSELDADTVAPALSAPPLRRADGLFECSDCWKTFEKAHSLQIHRGRWCKGPGSALEGLKPLTDAQAGGAECGRCGRAFGSTHGLRIHQAACNGQPSAAPKRKVDSMLPGPSGLYECDDCGRGFDSARGMLIHKGSCNGEPAPPPKKKPDEMFFPGPSGLFECDDCGRGFDSARGMLIHKGSCNGEPAPPPKKKPDEMFFPGPSGLFECDDCGRGFNTAMGVIIHKHTCNGAPAAPPKKRPDEMVPGPSGLFECEDCGRGFDTARGVIIHKSTCNGLGTLPKAHRSAAPPPPPPRGDGLYECEGCGRGFETPRGWQLHYHMCTGEAGLLSTRKKTDEILPGPSGLYECEDCGRGFDSVHGRSIHRACHCDIARSKRDEQQIEAARRSSEEKGKRRRIRESLTPSIQPPPGPPPLCRCGLPTTWERQRWWCAADEGSGCGYEARVPPSEFSLTPLCWCNQPAVHLRNFWWCAIPSASDGNSSGAAAPASADVDSSEMAPQRGCGFMVRANRPRPPSTASPQLGGKGACEAAPASSGLEGGSGGGEEAREGEPSTHASTVVALGTTSSDSTTEVDSGLLHIADID